MNKLYQCELDDGLVAQLYSSKPMELSLVLLPCASASSPRSSDSWELDPRLWFYERRHIFGHELDPLAGTHVNFYSQLSLPPDHRAIASSGSPSYVTRMAMGQLRDLRTSLALRRLRTRSEGCHYFQVAQLTGKLDE